MSVEVNITGTAIEEVTCDRANISISLAFDGTSLSMIKTEYNQLLKEICDKIEAEVSSETESDPEYSLNSDILRVRQSTEKVQKMFKEDTKEKVQAYSCIRADLDRDSRGVFNVLLDTLYGFNLKMNNKYKNRDTEFTFSVHITPSLSKKVRASVQNELSKEAIADGYRQALELAESIKSTIQSDKSGMITEQVSDVSLLRVDLHGNADRNMRYRGAAATDTAFVAKQAYTTDDDDIEFDSIGDQKTTLYNTVGMLFSIGTKPIK